MRTRARWTESASCSRVSPTRGGVGLLTAEEGVAGCLVRERAHRQEGRGVRRPTDLQAIQTGVCLWPDELRRHGPLDAGENRLAGDHVNERLAQSDRDRIADAGLARAMHHLALIRLDRAVRRGLFTGEERLEVPEELLEVHGRVREERRPDLEFFVDRRDVRFQRCRVQISEDLYRGLDRELLRAARRLARILDLDEDHQLLEEHHRQTVV